jgi:cobalt transporter subunit CbtB
MNTEGDMSETKALQQTTKITTLSDRLLVAVLGAVIGTFILLGVGFASANLIHNAAHDARHVNSFPCH